MFCKTPDAKYMKKTWVRQTIVPDGSVICSH